MILEAFDELGVGRWYRWSSLQDGPEDIKRTVAAMADYFNKRYQFYGRKIVIDFYDGKGSNTTELLGGGLDGRWGEAQPVAGAVWLSDHQLQPVTSPVQGPQRRHGEGCRADEGELQALIASGSASASASASVLVTKVGSWGDGRPPWRAHRTSFHRLHRDGRPSAAIRGYCGIRRTARSAGRGVGARGLGVTRTHVRDSVSGSGCTPPP